MANKILLIGYGSIGRRHAQNLKRMGVDACVLTRHPAGKREEFISNFGQLKDRRIDSCIISSPTGRHLKDFAAAIKALPGLRSVLIEKPLEATSRKARRIIELAKKRNIRVYVAYNLRFLRAFARIKDFVRRNKSAVRIVEIVAGQDLREWRPARLLAGTYSARRALGGGVDLDLSHEIDYALWLFGCGFKKKYLLRRKIGNMPINSPDICKLVLDYGSFIVDVTLDYLRRSAQRHIRIVCDNGRSLYFDLIKGALVINGRNALGRDTIDKTYRRMLKIFLGGKSTALCSTREALDVLKVLEV